jgi:hypothetical protein
MHAIHTRGITINMHAIHTRGITINMHAIQTREITINMHAVHTRGIKINIFTNLTMTTDAQDLPLSRTAAGFSALRHICLTPLNTNHASFPGASAAHSTGGGKAHHVLSVL